MKKIFAFHGCDSKAGVTMISQSCAEYISKALPDKEIIFVSLCGRRNNQFVREDIGSIDYYRDKIESGISISRREIEENRVAKNLYVVDGISEELESRHYFPESARTFLEDISKDFDLILVDTGSQLDNGLAIGGLVFADERYIVLSQNEAAFARYCRTKPLYEGLDVSFSGYIINKFSAKDIYSLDYIKKRLGIAKESLYKVCDCGEPARRKAEYERKTFFESKNKQYAQDIERLAEQIIEKAMFGMEDNTRKKKWTGFI